MGGNITNAGTLTLNNDIITDGQASDGGAIYNGVSATLTINDSTISGNTGSTGGAIYNNGESSLTIVDSSFVSNTSNGVGGAIFAYGDGITLTNSTLAYNTSASDGGAIYSEYFSSVVLNYVTISANTSGGGGGGVYDSGFGVTAYDTIIADNTASSDPDVDYAGSYSGFSGTNNLIGNGAGQTGITNGVNGNIVGQSANLSRSPTTAAPPRRWRCWLAAPPSVPARRSTGSPPTNAASRARPATPTLAPSRPPAPWTSSTRPTTATTAILSPARCAGRCLRQRPRRHDHVRSVHLCQRRKPSPWAGRLSITGDMSIVGPGANRLTISGDNASPIFGVASDVTASISGLSMIDGNGTYGGALFNEGTLTVSNSTFANNTTPSGLGGAVYNRALVGHPIDGLLTLTNDTFSNNSAAEGGAIDNWAGGDVKINNSTFNGNSSQDAGGAILNEWGTVEVTNSTFTLNTASGAGGAIMSEGNFAGTSVTVIDSTISGNSAATGGGIENQSSLTLANSIVAGNTATSSAPDIDGFITVDDGYNLLGSLVSGPAGSDIISDTPLLAALGYNGGPTETMALLPGSPALDAGNNSLASGLTTDQRGLSRTLSTARWTSAPSRIKSSISAVRR